MSEIFADAKMNTRSSPVIRYSHNVSSLEALAADASSYTDPPYANRLLALLSDEERRVNFNARMFRQYLDASKLDIYEFLRHCLEQSASYTASDLTAAGQYHSAKTDLHKVSNELRRQLDDHHKQLRIFFSANDPANELQPSKSTLSRIATDKVLIHSAWSDSTECEHEKAGASAEHNPDSSNNLADVEQRALEILDHLRNPHCPTSDVSEYLQDIELIEAIPLDMRAQFNTIIEHATDRLIAEGSDPLDPGIMSGIRILAASIPPDELDRLFKYIESGPPHSLDLLDLVLQRICEKCAYLGSPVGEFQNRLHARVVDIADQFVRTDVLAGSRNASIAISSVFALIAMGSPHSTRYTRRFQNQASDEIKKSFRCFFESTFSSRESDSCHMAELRRFISEF